MRRLCALAFFGYVILDLACPLVPGAFSFDPAQSVDAVSAWRLRSQALPRVMAAPPAMTFNPIRLERVEQAADAPAAPVLQDWRPHAGRHDALASDSRLSVDDD